MRRGESGGVVTYDADTATYRTTHDFSRGHTISATLIVALEAVADAEGIELERPLFEAIDLDGLAMLFEPTRRSPRDDGRVTFSVGDFRVTVYGSGDIVIAPPGDA